MHIDQLVELVIYAKEQDYESFQYHDTLDIIMLLDGEASLSIDGYEYKLYSEDIIMINPHELYRFDVQRGIALFFQFDIGRINQMNHVKEERHFNGNSTLEIRKEHYKSLQQQLCSLANTMIHYSEYDFAYTIYLSRLQELFYNLYYYFSERNFEIEQKNESTIKRFQQVLEDVHLNFRTPLSLKDLSQRHYLTQPYISNLFQRYMHQSYKEYITKLRVKEAQHLLETTTMTLTDIADRCGLPNVRSLNHYFGLQFQMTPKEYRVCHEKRKTDEPMMINQVQKYMNHYKNDGILIPKVRQQEERMILPILDLTKPENSHIENHHMLYVEHLFQLLYSSFQEIEKTMDVGFNGFRLLINDLIGEKESCVIQVKDKQIVKWHLGLLDQVLHAIKKTSQRPVLMIGNCGLGEREQILIIGELLKFFDDYFPDFYQWGGFCIWQDDAESAEGLEYLQIVKKVMEERKRMIPIYFGAPFEFFITHRKMLEASLEPDYLIAVFPPFQILKEDVDRFEQTLRKSGWKHSKKILSDLEISNPKYCTVNDSLIRTDYVANIWFLYYEIFCGTLAFLLVDYREDIINGCDVFYGGNGMHASNLFRKSSFYLWDNFKNSTGDIWDCDKIMLAYRDQTGITLLLRNNTLEKLYRKGAEYIQSIEYDTEYLDHYESIYYDITLKVDFSYRYKAHIFIVGPRKGCIYHYWMKAGAGKYITEKEVPMLATQSIPEVYTRFVVCEHQHLHFSVKLSPGEQVMIFLEQAD